MIRHSEAIELLPAAARRESGYRDYGEHDVDRLRFIRRVNSMLGYTRATLKHVEAFSRDWKPGERITFLDVATGSADIPRAIVRWGQRRGFDLRVTALDLHATTSRAAREACAGPGSRRTRSGSAPHRSSQSETTVASGTGRQIVAHVAPAANAAPIGGARRHGVSAPRACPESSHVAACAASTSARRSAAVLGRRSSPRRLPFCASTRIVSPSPK